MATSRTIIRIDEEKCNGCGQCVLACAEGAIAIVDGKARLVSETYCDGLGACIGECPQGAITTEVREAESFDPEAVAEHLARQGRPAPAHAAPEPALHGCPGAAVLTMAAQSHRAPAPPDSGLPAPRLTNWPIQIHLVPPTTPYLDGARLVIAADCTAFALPAFHREFLGDRVLLVGCPKLDDAGAYRERLAEIFRRNRIQDVELVYMEVPCCSGLIRVVNDAQAAAGTDIPVTLTKVRIAGEVADRAVVTA